MVFDLASPWTTKGIIMDTFLSCGTILNTKNTGLKDITFNGELHYWSIFEKEVQKRTMGRTSSAQGLYNQRHQSQIYHIESFIFKCGVDISTGARYVQRVLQPMSTVAKKLGSLMHLETSVRLTRTKRKTEKRV